MDHGTLNPEIEGFLREGSWLYAQPVAVACGTVLRCRTPQERLDALLRAGEILARYLAVVGTASYAARPESEVTGSEAPPATAGPLSFGHFVSLAQFTGRSKHDHPLAKELAAGFQSKTGPGKTEEALNALVNLRNEVGHQLQSMTEAEAISILRERRPAESLVNALRGVQYLLGSPLIVVEDQRFADGGVLVARVLFLMGEIRDPQPRELRITTPFQKNRSVYLGRSDGALLLSPLLLWEISEVHRNYGLFILDKVEDHAIRYKAIGVSSVEKGEEFSEQVRAVLAGDRRPLEGVLLDDARGILHHWLDERRRIQASVEQREGTIPWDSFDKQTLQWYASRLDGETSTDPRGVVQQRLLDDRQQLPPDEINQLVLLFGREKDIKSRLGREMIDLRARTDPDARWSERVEAHANILTCLRQSVEFLARHLNVGESGVTLDGLRATTGSADYVAIREALVNLFIHQDYGDRSAAAQIEISPDKALFFNPGRSLVGREALLLGGKSQARNPLVARALRLIGFAELAGSGLRELQRVWRQAQRRPPRIESSDKANHFGLTLDWRTVPNAYNAFWKGKIGAKVSAEQAKILNLALDPAGVSVDEVVSATGLDLAEAEEALRYLKLQVLVEERNGRYHIRPLLRELVEEGAEPHSGQSEPGP